MVTHNIYKIAHFHSYNHDKDSLFVETELSPQKFIHIISAITFKFEELVPHEDNMDERHLLRILEGFYNITNKTDQYRKYLPYTQLPLDDWEMTNTFTIPTEPPFEITQIDWYEARESCCGAAFVEGMEIFLPQSPEFVAAITGSLEFYS